MADVVIPRIEVGAVTADALLAALRSRGVDSNDLRYAVHEAQHALDLRLRPGTWSVTGIDRAMKCVRPGDAALSEIRARAVEQIVCASLGVPVEPIAHWALTSCMESIKFRDPFFDYDDCLAAITASLGAKRTLDDARAIVALAVETRRVRSRVRKAASP